MIKHIAQGKSRASRLGGRTSPKTTVELFSPDSPAGAYSASDRGALTRCTIKCQTAVLIINSSRKEEKSIARHLAEIMKRPNLGNLKQTDKVNFS